MATSDQDKFGLTERDMKTLRDILDKYPGVQSVFIFGSRAKGSSYKGSDIDLAIMNEGVSETVIAQMKADFQESALPYFVDVIDYPSLRHPELKGHIDRVGKPFYQKKTGFPPSRE
jgi:predicted nucleotidyltransferase